MPIALPASPSIGQTSVQNGRTYTWSGYAWELTSNVSSHANTHSTGGSDAISIDTAQLLDGFVYDCGEYIAIAPTPAPTATPAPTPAPTATPTATPAPASLLTIARNNGTSTFTGLGTTASPFVRADGFLWDNADGLSRYSWTATGSATVTVRYNFTEGSGDGFCSRVLKNGTRINPDNCGGTATRTFAVVSGDVITIGVDITPSQSFSNVSVSAA